MVAAIPLDGPGPRHWDGTFWDRGSIFVAAEDYADNPILGPCPPPSQKPADVELAQLRKLAMLAQMICGQAHCNCPGANKIKSTPCRTAHLTDNIGAARIALVSLRRSRIGTENDMAIAAHERLLQAHGDVVYPEGAIFDSKALTETDWHAERDALLADGWQFLKCDAKVVYVRRPRD